MTERTDQNLGPLVPVPVTAVGVFLTDTNCTRAPEDRLSPRRLWDVGARGQKAMTIRQAAADGEEYVAEQTQTTRDGKREHRKNSFRERQSREQKPIKV